MPLTSDTKKLMFEIYRDTSLTGQYKVVYFTELGEHVFDGFLLHRDRQEGKQVVEQILGDLNRGETVDPAMIEEKLKPYLAK